MRKKDDTRNKAISLLKMATLTPTQKLYLEDIVITGSMPTTAKNFNKAPHTVRETVQRLVRRQERERLEARTAASQAVSGTSTLFKTNEETGEQEKVLEWVKTNTSKAEQLEAMQVVIAELVNDVAGKAKATKFGKTVDTDLLTVYVSTDLHLGQYAWHEEAGKDVNLDSVRTNTVTAMGLLTSVTPQASNCLVLDLGDTLHSSNDDARTKSGHVLDTDGRHAKVFQVVVDMKIEMINLALKKHKKVTYVIVAGNHSDLVGHYIAALLNAYFRNEPRFSVDTGASLHKYYRHGETLLGFHHGHATKMGRLPEVMVWDRKEDISSTTYRYWLTGHVHKDTVFDNPIARCESFRNLTGNDAWAQGAGYRGHKQATAITYHTEFGEISRNIVPVNMVE